MQTASQTLKAGTRIETHGCPAMGSFPGVAPERLVICKPRKSQLPLEPDWYIVKFADGGKLCMHTSRFRVVDNRAA